MSCPHVVTLVVCITLIYCLVSNRMMPGCFWITTLGSAYHATSSYNYWLNFRRKIKLRFNPKVTRSNWTVSVAASLLLFTEKKTWPSEWSPTLSSPKRKMHFSCLGMLYHALASAQSNTIAALWQHWYVCVFNIVQCFVLSTLFFFICRVACCH